MTKYLREGTAVSVIVGVFVDDEDGKTEKNALVIGAGDVFLSKTGGALTAKNESSDPVFDKMGYYTVNLNDADTDTEGALRLVIHAAGALPVFEDFIVLPKSVYDSMIRGTELLNVTTGGAGAIEWEYSLTEPDLITPIADVDIWVTTDLAGNHVIAKTKTNQYGIATFYLDAGTVYVWCQKTGFNFTNPDQQEIVS